MNDKTARRVKDNLPEFEGYAAFYELSEPLDDYRHVIVLADGASLQTTIYPADENGNVVFYQPLQGSFRGGLDHRGALANAGYIVE